MVRHIRFTWLLAAGLGAALAAPASAQTRGPQGAADPDWPCAQRRMRTIAAETVWSGPPLAAAGAWGGDFEAASLAQKLASRRTPISDADALLDAFATAAGPDKTVRLTRVFVGVHELINGERDRVMSGIERYARGQRRMAERVRDEADTVSAAKDSPDAPTSPATAEVETRFQWDRRIFEERSRSLTYVCEVPVFLEQRLFEIGRLIQARL